MENELQPARDSQSKTSLPLRFEKGKKGRKDLRNKEKESAQWKPGKWGERKIREFSLHVHKRSIVACADILGPHEGNILAAKLVAEHDERLSVLLLHAKGVKLIGDV
jgi:hypothetical protein